MDESSAPRRSPVRLLDDGLTQLQTRPDAGQSTDKVVLISIADDRYAIGLAVALFSALTHLDPARHVCVYVLEDGVSGPNKVRIARVVKTAHPAVHLEWRSPDLTCFDHLKMTHWYTRATLLSLMAPSEVPDHFDRAILIDSDVVVEQNLALIWDEGLRNHFLLAVENYNGPTVETELRGIYEGLGLRPDTPYFNTGVMVMNLRRWRAERITERVIAFLERFGERASYLEQDGLNAVVAGDWGKLDPSWNVQLVTLHTYRRHQADPEERRRLQDELVANPSILHYTGHRKPWHWRYRGLADEAFFRSLRASGWFGGLQGKMFVSSRRISHALYRMLSHAKRAVHGLRQLSSSKARR